MKRILVGKKCKKCGQALGWIFSAVLASLVGLPRAQNLSSGSDGSDGALDLSGLPAGTVLEFNPETFSPPLDRDMDNTYHFTTIFIPSGVRVKLTAKYLNGPVYWLATGGVHIGGTIDLNGEDGHPRAGKMARRPAFPGAGGYSGGIGGNPGNGPTGGRAGYCPCNYCVCQGGGSGGSNVTGFIVPLAGGSGGGGGLGVNSSGGGAGGGAILIASPDSIIVTGAITALGGSGGGGGPPGDAAGGPGGSGAIRLFTRKARVTGNLLGNVRVEAFQRELSAGWSAASPYNVFLPTRTPNSRAAIRAVSINGIPVPINPGGLIETPDAVINETGNSILSIEAMFIPVGTRIRVHVASEEYDDQVIESMPLSGSFEASSATASIPIPQGYHRIFVQVSWNP